MFQDNDNATQATVWTRVAHAVVYYGIKKLPSPVFDLMTIRFIDRLQGFDLIDPTCRLCSPPVQSNLGRPTWAKTCTLIETVLVIIS